MELQELYDEKATLVTKMQDLLDEYDADAELFR